MLIRTWNVFHGNSVPPGRIGFLEQAVRLAGSGEPAVVALQELPVWSFGYLDDWSELVALADVAARPLLPRSLARWVTALNQGLFRSLFTGQGNALLIEPGLRLLARSSIVLNPHSFRRRHELPVATRLAWARERRVCQAARLALPDDRTLTVANFHATKYSRDPRPAEGEVVRAAVFLDAVAEPTDVVVLAGDFNLTPARSRVYDELAGWGFSTPGPGIDHVLVRGAASGAERHWPEDRRRIGNVLVSDHAPLEVELE